MINSIQREIHNLEISQSKVHNFALLFGVIFCGWAALMCLKSNANWIWFALVGVCFIVTAFANPMVLRLVYLLWMSLAIVMGWFMTRIILIIFYFLILTPIGLFMRAIGKDLLDIDFKNRKADSYWKKTESTQEAARYERQF